MTLKLPKTNNRIISMLIFLGLVGVCFITVVILTSRPAQSIGSTAELRGFDFSNRTAYISPSAFERFPEALYTPEDFAAGITEADAGWDGENPRYATYRLVLDNLTEGTVYGISGYSATHAMTLWVDGVILAQAGTPGDSLEAMTAGANYFAAYFTASAEPTEIVIQRSSFVLVHGGRLSSVYLGEQHLITQMNTLAHARISLIVGVTLMAALVNLGIFVFFKSRTRFILFSLVCLMIALRTLGIDNRMIATLFPNMAWHIDYIIGYLSTSGFIIFIVLYVSSMFQNKVHRFITIGVVSVLSLHSIFILLTPSTVYSYLQIPYNIFIMAFTVAVLFNIIWLTVKDRSMRHSEHILVLIGTVANVTLGLVEGIVRSIDPQVPQNLTQIGALVFMFLNVIALALYFNRTERELAAANDERRRLEADEIRLNSEKEALARLNRLKTDLMRTFSHETLTPLAVIMGYAQITANDARKSGEGTEFVENLDAIAAEAKRMSGMMEEMRQLALAREYTKDRQDVDIAKVIRQVAGLYATVLERKGTELKLDIADDIPHILGNDDEIIQIIFNLLRNSDNYTENGTVTIRAELCDGKVMVTVSDTGTGITPELLPHVFERGVSGSKDSSGFGLAISKDIVTAYGGEIWIESSEDGTIARFTLLAYEC